MRKTRHQPPKWQGSVLPESSMVDRPSIAAARWENLIEDPSNAEAYSKNEQPNEEAAHKAERTWCRRARLLSVILWDAVRPNLDALAGSRRSLRLFRLGAHSILPLLGQ